MNITCDASLLGLGHYGAKTGLFRVADNFIKQLSGYGDYQLSLCSSLSFDVWVSTQEYLEEDECLQNLPFMSQSQARNMRKAFYHGGLSSASLLHRFGLFNQRKAPYTLLNGLNYQFQPIDPADLASQHIYHSLYHAIPNVAKANTKLIKFLTVHDLIPLLHPEWFGIGTTISQFDKNFDLPKILNTLDRETWIICMSRSTKDDLCTYMGNRIDESKVLVIYSAASGLFYSCHNPEKILNTQKKYGIPAAPYVLSLGTLEPRKNFMHTIHCFNELIQAENIAELNLVLIGHQDWYYPELFSMLAQTPSLSARVIMTGFVDDNDLAALYSGALVFVYPSLYEGFGLPPLEAMQCGTPVITSNTSSLPEVVGDAGITVNPQDRDELSQAILDLYLHPVRRDGLSQKSLARSHEFSWEKCIHETTLAYERAN